MHLDYHLTKYISKLISCKTKLHLDHHLITYAKIKIIVKTSKIKNLVFIEPLNEKSFLNGNELFFQSQRKISANLTATTTKAKLKPNSKQKKIYMHF